MPLYPDWVVALDDVAKGAPHATVTPSNAQDIIREIEKMQARIAELEGRPRSGKPSTPPLPAPTRG